jgi:hypothetical protein
MSCKKDKLDLAHIVNPIVIGQSSDLYIAQPANFQTLLSAKRFGSVS